MKVCKKLLLTAALVLLGATTASARPHLLGHRRTCVSPAPTQPAPRYQTIPAPLVPVPAIPPAVVMPQTGQAVLPVRNVIQTVGGCIGGICPIR